MVNFLDIDDLLDLTSIWFYVPLFSILLFGLISVYIYSKIYLHKSNDSINILYFIILGFMFLADLSIYIISIRICPHTFISYFLSIYFPLLLIFITLIYSILSVIQSIAKFKWAIGTIIDFVPQTFYIIAIKISFGLAYGSPSSIIWILFDFVVTLGKAMVISQRFELSYDKKID